MKFGNYLIRVIGDVSIIGYITLLLFGHAHINMHISLHVDYLIRKVHARALKKSRKLDIGQEQYIFKRLILMIRNNA